MGIGWRYGGAQQGWKGGRRRARQVWDTNGSCRAAGGCLADVGAKIKMMWVVGLKLHHEDALLTVTAKETSAVTFPVPNAFNHLETRSTAQLGVTGLCRQPAACSPACLGGIHGTT